MSDPTADSGRFRKDASRALERAADDEPIFVLRARDLIAPETVREWAYRAAKAGAPREKVVEARACADAMEDWQLEHDRKVPD